MEEIIKGTFRILEDIAVQTGKIFTITFDIFFFFKVRNNNYKLEYQTHYTTPEGAKIQKSKFTSAKF